MSDWAIGDVMICINTDNCKVSIKIGLQYVINDIRICPTCGMMEFKLSIPFPNENGMVCVACRTKFEKELLDCWWAEHWRFKKVISDKKESEKVSVKLQPKEIVKEFDILAN
jgi:hypothetical protein